MTNTIVLSIAEQKQVSKPSNDNLRNAICSTLNYPPPQDYVWPDNGFDRLVLECQLEYTQYVRDFASEGCFFDMEQGADHVE